MNWINYVKAPSPATMLKFVLFKHIKIWKWSFGNDWKISSVTFLSDVYKGQQQGNQITFRIQAK